MEFEKAKQILKEAKAKQYTDDEAYSMTEEFIKKYKGV